MRSTVVTRANHPNAHILVDALHVFRSGTPPQEFAALDPALLGPLQLCDAPATPPADLIAEARTRRLLPGAGELALPALIDALPRGHSHSASRCRSRASAPDLDPGARLALLASATRDFLKRRNA